MANEATPAPTVSDERNWVKTGVVILLVWAAACLVLATRPTTDSVPLVTPDESVQSQAVGCNSYLASRARDDVPLPALPEGFAYAREACEAQHTQGRILLVVDAVFLLGCLALAARLRPRHPAEQPVAVAA